jgi:GcrA cell cycle regulator
MNWTTAHDDQLRALVAEGLSAGQIAAEMKGGLSRNAVIGRMGRINLKSQNPYRRPPMSQEERLLRRRADQRKRRNQTPIYDGPVRTRTERSRGAGMQELGLVQRLNGEGQAHGDHPHNPSLAEFNAAIPIEQRITLIELGPEHCRFPLWGDDERSGFYCGHPSADMPGRPFCAAHSHFAYNGKSEARPWLAGRP